MGEKNGKALMQKSKFDISADNANSLIESIVKDFKEGIDYGKVFEGAKKDCLLKPGSEKLCLVFGIRPVFLTDTDTLTMLKDQKNLIAFKCELIDRKTGNILGEGRGAVQLGEKASLRNINTAIKIAEKRAQIDGVLRLFALSDRFTQDIEPDEVKPENEKTKISINENGDISL